MILKRLNARWDWVILLTGAAWLLVDTGRGSLATWDEAMYAHVAREIFQTGDGWNLSVLGQDWYVKPPLYMWLTAAVFAGWGVSDFTARFVSGLAGIGCVALVYTMGVKLFDLWTARVAACVLATTTYFVYYCHSANLDVLNLFFILSAIYSYLKTRERRVYWMGVYAAVGLGFMTKGPAALVSVIVIVLDMIWARRVREAFTRWHLPGFLLLGALVIPWHGAAYQHNPHLFMQDYIQKHWISRTASSIEGHEGGGFFYFVILWRHFRPWILALPLVLMLLARRAGPRSPSNDGLRLVGVWIAGVLGVYTWGVQTKLAWYILPVFPALALAVGAGVSRLMEFFPRMKPLFLLAVIFLSASLFYGSEAVRADYNPALKQLAGLVNAQVPVNQKIYLYRYPEIHAAKYYLNREVEYLDDEKAWQDLRKQENAFVILHAEDRVRLERIYDFWDWNNWGEIEGMDLIELVPR